jgi:hypothetical protein
VLPIFGWYLIIAKLCWIDILHQGWVVTYKTSLFYFRHHCWICIIPIVQLTWLRIGIFTMYYHLWNIVLRLSHDCCYFSFTKQTLRHLTRVSQVWLSTVVLFLLTHLWSSLMQMQISTLKCKDGCCSYYFLWGSPAHIIRRRW